MTTDMTFQYRELLSGDSDWCEEVDYLRSRGYDLEYPE